MNGVGLLRTGSPTDALRSSLRTFWRDRLAAFRCRACAMTYGSCFLLWAAAERVDAGLDEQVQGFDTDADEVMDGRWRKPREDS